MKIYLAGTYFRKEDEMALSAMKNLLEANGYDVWWCREKIGNNYGKTDEATRRFVVETEKRAIRDSDTVVALAKAPTPGTMMEIIFAYENGIPVIVITKNEALNASPWVHYHARVVENENALLEALANKMVS